MIALHLPRSKWRKSSRSANLANCVEVARSGVAVGVRDSKDRDGAVLVFAAGRWADFVGALQRRGA
jgi:hypothetical protein